MSQAFQRRVRSGGAILTVGFYGIFTLLCVRLLFTEYCLYGATWVAQTPWFFALIISFFLFGFLCPPRLSAYVLVFIPVLGGLREGGQLPVIEGVLTPLAAFFMGWLSQCIASKRSLRPQNSWDAGVQALGILVFASLLFTLITPSWTNARILFWAIPSLHFFWELSGIISAQVFLTGCAIFLLVRQTLSTRESSERTLVAISLLQATVILMTGAIGVFLYYKIPSAESRPPIPEFFLGGWHGAGAAFAFAFFVFLSIALGWVGKRRFIVLALAGVVVSGVFLISTGSKSSWLGAVLAAGVLIFILLRQRNWLRISITVGLVLIALGGMILFGLSQPRGELGNRIHNFFSVSTWENQNSERLSIYRKSLSMIAANPLSGVGLGKFSHNLEYYGDLSFIGKKLEDVYDHPEKDDGILSFYNPRTQNSFHAHNSFLQMASESGILAAIGLAALWIGAIFFGFCVLREPVGANGRILALISLLTIVCWLVPNLVDTRILSDTDGLIIWQFFACALPLTKSTRHLPVVFIVLVLGLLGYVFSPGQEFREQDARIFGIFNWTRKSPDQFYDLAAEAQFYARAEAPVRALVLRAPSNQEGPVTVKIELDGLPVKNLVIQPGDISRVDLDYSPEKARYWIRIISDRWAGRGALGTRFGLNPFALQIQRLYDKPADSPTQ